MSKILLTVCLWVTLIFLSAPQGWSGQDLEDRFINPDSETSKAIFIDVKGASLVNVLKIISKQTGLSFIASHDVEDKSITVYLNKVPLNQALETILSANGLAYEMQGDSNIFLIKPAVKTETTKITKVFQLKYATVSTSKLNSTIDAGGGGKGGSGLEEVLKDCQNKKIPVASVVCTMATTDANAFDPVADVRKILDNYPNPEGYGKALLYCDSVIGWSWLAFKNYNFKENPLGFSDAVLPYLEKNYNAIKGIFFADAFGV